MTDPGTELISVLLVLLPVVVGSVLALLSAAYAQKLQSKTDKEKRRAEKFEELVTALYEHDHWLEDVRNYRVLGEEAPKGVGAAVERPCYFDGLFSRASGKDRCLWIDLTVIRGVDVGRCSEACRQRWCCHRGSQRGSEYIPRWAELIAKGLRDLRD
jgi:hypothetical protein